MRIIVATVGAPRNRPLAEAIADYETRAARYWPLETRAVKEERLMDAVADLDLAEVCARYASIY